MRWNLAGWVLLGCWVVGLAAVSAAVEVDEKTQKKIEVLEPMLPEIEKWADELDGEVGKLADSKDPTVQVALDSARLRIAALRSLRKMIAKSPGFIYHIGVNFPQVWKEGAQYYLECAKAGKDPFAGTTNGVRPYRSPIDGQILFYRYALPKTYDPAKKYPVDVNLHSGAGFNWLASWVGGKPDSDRPMREDVISITPAGRQHVGVGAIANMDAIRDAVKHYSIDENRVVIGGASWGGSGTYHVATLYPDVFAAAWELTGGTYYGMPKDNGRFDGMLLSENLCNTAFCSFDTPNNWWENNHAFAELLKTHASKYPGFYPNLEMTDPKGGHGIINRDLIQQGWDWMRKQSRNPFPRLVVYKSYCLRYDGAWWACLDTVEDPEAPARIEADLRETGKLKVSIGNADRFHVNLAKELVGDAKELEVQVNGGNPFKVPTGKTVYCARENGNWGASERRYPEGLIKKHGLSGPIQDVFMEQPVLMVYGSLEARETGKVQEVLDHLADQLVGPGDGGGVLRTGFERKADKDVSDKDIAEKNLVLVGTPGQNALLAKIVGRLPVKYLEDGVEIGGKQYKGEKICVTLVYPNPLNPERYVLLVSEDYAGGLPWTFPDYVVGKTAPGYGGLRQQVLVQGTFDSRWKIK